MCAPGDANNPKMGSGAEIHGFKVKRAEALPAIQAFFYELWHPATGARHIHVSRPDPENTFGVVFRTVPRDSTGVAHILEHTVLCGSERFAVRDPFFSMLKRSLNTFMNAFTASDWTMYPFATQNRKDFYNLMDAYLDAAFFPRIDELSFKQEGHRLELEGEDPGGASLAYKGVVYNEMKGAMSAPDQVMVRSILKALYPDTTYSNNSGGEPAEIPRLTYAQLKEFHRHHYHPSNACFFTYGDMPLADHLAFIANAVLGRFDAIEPSTAVAPQPRWAAPKVVRFPYPFGRDEDPARKHQACLGWLTADIQDTGEVLALSLLEQVLIGNAASPLRRALIDSGLGSALCDGSGYDSENRDTLFVVGLKDTEEGAAERVEAIVLEVIGALAEGGIDPELIETAIHKLEFHRKEVTNTPYAFGIKLLLSAVGTWIHGGDPLRVLNFDADLAEIRRGMQAGGFFERLLARHLRDNPHRVRLTLYPDTGMADRETARVQEELGRIRDGLSGPEREKLRQEAAELKRLQDAAENVDCLPTLQREDIPPDVVVVAADDADAAHGVAFYRQATSGILYLDAVAGSGGLAPEANRLVPFFCHAFPRVGTTLRDYAEMARRVDAATGGFGLSAHPRNGFEGAGECVPFVALSAKSLNRNQAAMAEILLEHLGRYSFADTARLKNLLLEYRAALESMVVPNGHRLAMSLAARHFSAARELGELWSGVHQLKFIKEVTGELSAQGLAAFAAELEALAGGLLRRGNFRVAVIGEPEVLAASRPLGAEIAAVLSAGDSEGFTALEAASGHRRVREGWSTATAVNFVAAVFPTVRLGHADAAALAVIAKMLRSLYLHREIREKGGAYGGFAVYNSEDGTFGLASYRDPHIAQTLGVFQGAAEFICGGGFAETDVNEAILQVCAEIDKPDPPGPAARKAFYRDIIRLTDALRLEFKQRLIALNVRQVAEAAQRWFGEGLKECSVAVIGSEEALKEANTQLGEPLALRKI